MAKADDAELLEVGGQGGADQQPVKALLYARRATQQDRCGPLLSGRGAGGACAASWIVPWF